MIITVDGYCLSNPGKGGYQAHDITNGVDKKVKLFEVHIDDGTTTNNIVEYLAIVHALAYCQKNAIARPEIYSDSMTGITWATKHSCNTNLNGRTEDTRTSRKLIERADKYLQQECVYTVRDTVFHWSTKELGENPSDFGNKNNYYPKK